MQLAQKVASEAGGGRVCDIGCGYGAPAVLLAESGAEVLAVTNSRAQFEALPQHPRLLSQHGDWLALKPPANRLDALIALESMEHFADKAAFFHQARQWLRPGGKLVLAGWQAARPSRLLPKICKAAQMPPLLTEAECLALAASAGFELLRREDCTRAVCPTWPRMGWALARRPRSWWVALRHWRFALTALRITAAFHTGTLRYAVITLTAQ